MRLLSWNVQWCRGVDGRVDPARIAAEVRRLADPDVVCLQELAANLPQLAGTNEDQAHALAHLLPEYTTCFVSGVDVPSAALPRGTWRGESTGSRRGYFGNVVFSRLPVGRILRHSLPWPSAPDVPSMPRVAVEAVLDAPIGPLRILCTHLEYYSDAQRAAQVGRLREIHAEACARQFENEEPGIFKSHPRPPSAILCGDFNMPPEDPLHAEMQKQFPAPDIPRFVDAWQALNPGKPHPHTFRLYQKEEGETPYCCDYVFVTEDLVARLKSVRVDGLTQASDHQPVVLEFT
jgi:endonuclease/exonuclease/phosphatase family metal-dependent hydrolase